MKRTILIVLATALAAFGQEKTFTGVITDSMCGNDHAMMKITPDPKCVRDCVHGAKTVKYGLYDGKQTYKLSDQATPEQFAGQRVRIVGTLYPATGIIAVRRIEAAK